ncbi:hypothetical protein FOL47_001681 [Perkinsus chesapeaki]|uniref:Uncharacterized protein n=1 Tax=Perkinsus chesapeaki TaxID=330153 RepID=A0A7J6KSK8_PERCH|nr:hypothetical protein FOL47_001681 [Perkinsus chesapeaki]
MSTIIDPEPEGANDTPLEKVVDLTEDDIPLFSEYDSVVDDDTPFVKEEETADISHDGSVRENDQHASPVEDAEQLGLFEGLSDDTYSEPVYPTLSPLRPSDNDIEMTALQPNEEQSETASTEPEANSDVSFDGEPVEEPTPDRCAAPINRDDALSPESELLMDDSRCDAEDDMFDSRLIEGASQAVEGDVEVPRESASELFEDTQIQSGPSASLTPTRTSERQAEGTANDNSSRATEFETPQSEFKHNCRAVDACQDQLPDDQSIPRKRQPTEPDDPASQSERDASVLSSGEVFDSSVMEAVFKLLKYQGPVPEMGIASNGLNGIRASLGQIGKRGPSVEEFQIPPVGADPPDPAGAQDPPGGGGVLDPFGEVAITLERRLCKVSRNRDATIGFSM